MALDRFDQLNLGDTSQKVKELFGQPSNDFKSTLDSHVEIWQYARHSKDGDVPTATVFINSENKVISKMYGLTKVVTTPQEIEARYGIQLKLQPQAKDQCLSGHAKSASPKMYADDRVGFYAVFEKSSGNYELASLSESSPEWRKIASLGETKPKACHPHQYGSDN